MDSQRGQQILEEGGPGDTEQEESPCTDCWKAAKADTIRTTYKEFQQSGIFLSACRHGLILFLADMIHSGEL